MIDPSSIALVSIFENGISCVPFKRPILIKPSGNIRCPLPTPTVILQDPGTGRLSCEKLAEVSLDNCIFMENKQHHMYIVLSLTPCKEQLAI